MSRVGPRGYYTEKLAAERLRACYELAPPRTRTYLEAEIAFVLERTTRETVALELGCGYGRVLRRLVAAARVVIGIDISLPSLLMARDFVPSGEGLRLLATDAGSMGLRDGSVDLTVCIQNGISAFKVDPFRLFAEAIRVTRRGGAILFSSYSPSFWEDRLEWFRAQSARGLIGELDQAATGNGVIVSKDGFRATTASREDFLTWCRSLHVEPRIVEVDNSSLFCEITVP